MLRIKSPDPLNPFTPVLPTTRSEEEIIRSYLCRLSM